MSVPTFTKSGTKATTTAKLDSSVFGLEVTNHELLKQAYVAYLANGRLNLAKTKTRGLVSGGGRKPWKQKGTGRARFGSSRNPIWRGGGIVFGPTGEENYSHALPVKAKRQAIRQALSVCNDKIAVIESFDVKSGKTSDAEAILNKLGAGQRTLLVVATQLPEVVRSVKNLQNVKLVSATYVNVYDVLNADRIVFEQKALSAISDWLGATKKTAKEGDK
jgi:large subunit ribosomal protein L4